MADGNGVAALTRKTNSAGQLRFDGRSLVAVIEKHIAARTGNAVATGGGLSDTCSAGATIDKKQIVAGNLGHHPTHGLGLLGQQAAHMVIHTHYAGNGADGVSQTAGKEI